MWSDTVNQKKRDSKTYLNFGNSAYCHRQLDRLSIKQVFFFITDVSEFPNHKKITMQKSAFFCSLYPGGVGSCFCTVSSLICVTTQKCFDVTRKSGRKIIKFITHDLICSCQVLNLPVSAQQSCISKIPLPVKC